MPTAVSPWIHLLWPPYAIGQAIIFLPCGFFFLLSFFYLLFSLAYSQPSHIGCLPYFHTWCGLSANLGCRSETCCTQLGENTGHKKSPKVHHLGTVTQFCRAMSVTVMLFVVSLVSLVVMSLCVFFFSLCVVTLTMDPCGLIQINNNNNNIFATEALIDKRKSLVKQQYLLHMFPQYGELRPTSGWDRFVSLGHPS